jgi:hypothetical protein
MGIVRTPATGRDAFTEQAERQRIIAIVCSDPREGHAR